MLLTIQVQFYKYVSATSQSKHYIEPSFAEHDQMTIITISSHHNYVLCIILGWDHKNYPYRCTNTTYVHAGARAHIKNIFPDDRVRVHR